MEVALAVVVGSLLGSFLSVLLARWETGEGIIVGRSRCPRCAHVLAWYDLVPLASWAALRGRCRYCRARISALYPTLELVVAAAFGFFVYQFGFSAWTAVDLLILFGLLALFFFDLRSGMLPDVFTLPFTGLAVLALVLRTPSALLGALAMGAALALLFGGLHLFSRGRLVGLGDAKLGMLVGVFLGYPTAVTATLLAIWIGAALGLGLIMAGRATMKTALPFGALWIAVVIVAMLWPTPFAALGAFLTLP